MRRAADGTCGGRGGDAAGSTSSACSTGDDRDELAGVPVFCSWSGGKDSCLALHRAIRAGARPRALLTMLVAGGGRTRSHGLPVETVRSQAAALGIPLVCRAGSWPAYERRFGEALEELRRAGTRDGVFGDIDVDAHRRWVEGVCGRHGVRPHLPLWREARPSLLEEFVAAGFEATVVAVRAGVLDRDLLGRSVDGELVRELEAAGVDLCGEAGEYHTVVTAGPIFRRPLRLRTGRAVMRDGYWFLDVDAGR